jgi:hypothetical protein
MSKSTLALCFFGIHYNESYKLWMSQEKVTVDYRKSIENYRQTIFKLYEENSKYETDVYLSTYNSKILPELIKDFEPLDYYSVDKPPTGSKAFVATGGYNREKNERILKFRDLIQKPYDWYLFTRFDLLFNLDFMNLHPDPNKINVLALLEREDAVCDNLYLISKEQIDFFYQCFEKNIDLYRHHVSFFNGIQNIHFLTNEAGRTAQDLDCYKFVRDEKLYGPQNKSGTIQPNPIINFCQQYYVYLILLIVLIILLVLFMMFWK